MDIGAWLRDLGLERYEEAFQAGEIDPEVLPELADEIMELDEWGDRPRQTQIVAIGAALDTRALDGMFDACTAT